MLICNQWRWESDGKHEGFLEPGNGIFPRCRRSEERGARRCVLGEYVDRIATELHERMEHQRAVLRKVLGESGPGREEIRYCPLVDCPRIEALRSAIRETIAVLEETRSAFKSKRLEVLRRKLVEVPAVR